MNKDVNTIKLNRIYVSNFHHVVGVQVMCFEMLRSDYLYKNSMIEK
jgi:hypothetical protein